MRLILFDAFLAVCIATITAETLSDDNSSDASIFEEELPQDLLWNDLETHLLSADYDISNVDLFAPKDISSSTTDLASSRLDAPSCLLNGNDQPLLRRARARRDGETGASSCDANSKPWYPPGQPTGPDQLDETLWKEFYGSPGDNEPEPEEPSTLIPILKDPKEINQNCLPEFPKHLCCVQRGPLEGEYLTRMIYTRMYQCEIAPDNVPCIVKYDVCCADMYQDARTLLSSPFLPGQIYAGMRCYQHAISLLHLRRRDSSFK